MRLHKGIMIIVGVAIGLVPAVAGRANAQAAACGPGARVVANGVVEDRVLHQRWAVFADCVHPERPLRMVQVSLPSGSPETAPPQFAPTRESSNRTLARPIAASRAAATVSARFRAASSAGQAKPVLIQAGDRVHLWSAGTNIRLEIEGIALEYGRAGQVIHVRRLGSAGSKALLAAVVDGAGSAELLP